MASDSRHEWSDLELRSNTGAETILENQEGARFSVREVREDGLLLLPVVKKTKDNLEAFEKYRTDMADPQFYSWSNLTQGQFTILYRPNKGAIIERGIKNYSDFWYVFSHTGANRREIEVSEICGCIFCLGIFSPVEIWKDERRDPGEEEWDSEEELDFVCCPRCMVDEVIGSASGYPITAEFLEQLHEYSFPEFPISWVRERYS